MATNEAEAKAAEPGDVQLRAASEAPVQRISSGLAVPAASSIVRFYHVPLRFAVTIDTAHTMADDTERIARSLVAPPTCSPKLCQPVEAAPPPRWQPSRFGARASLPESKVEEKRVDDSLRQLIPVAHEAVDINSKNVRCFFLAF